MVLVWAWQCVLLASDALSWAEFRCCIVRKNKVASRATDRNQAGKQQGRVWMEVPDCSVMHTGVGAVCASRG